jgi:hypothetical protein
VDGISVYVKKIRHPFEVFSIFPVAIGTNPLGLLALKAS